MIGTAFSGHVSATEAKTGLASRIGMEMDSGGRKWL